MKTLLVSANCGQFLPDVPWPDLGPAVDIQRLTDATFPPRPSLTPRLQAKIPKLFAWQLWPGYDVYVWVDARFIPQPGGVEWLVGHLGDADAVFIRHPERQTVGEEWAFLETELARGHRYLTKRYAGEWPPPFKPQDRLLAAGIFAYRYGTLNAEVIEGWMSTWWASITRYHVNDQLTLTRALHTWGVDYTVLDDNIFALPLFPCVNLRDYRKEGPNEKTHPAPARPGPDHELPRGA